MKEQILGCVSPDYPWKDRFHFLPEVDSTNDYLKKLAAEGAPHGTVALSDHQTGGHGRRGRSFLSPPGVGLYLSILLRPACPPTRLMHLTCATGVAMCNAIEQSAGFRPGIKWTNDIVYDKRKLGGILTELRLNAQGLVDYAIVGIGINCCQTAQDFPPEIWEVAGSLAMVTGQEIDRFRVAAAELDALYDMSAKLLTEQEAMLTQYRKDCITIGQEVSLVRGDDVRHGTALDVDDEGALVVLFPDGHTEAVNSGEVSVRGMYGYV
ncbi:MAG: biotin--[acetyl-CoA-carboxylase] ligase [Eubacteriales bacterium]|nr:biotin--[acetyl-CoA-carboxylase] ligase [Eubacteriales bacterium]